MKNALLKFVVFFTVFFLVQNVFFFGGWQFMAYAIFAGVVLGLLNEPERLSRLLPRALIDSAIFTFATVCALFILIELVASGNFFERDFGFATLAYVVASFIGCLAGIAIRGSMNLRLRNEE